MQQAMRQQQMQAMQSMMQNPEAMQQLLRSHPLGQQLAQTNPHVGQLLNDPAFMQQISQRMQDPAVMQAAMQMQPPGMMPPGVQPPGVLPGAGGRPPFDLGAMMQMLSQGGGAAPLAGMTMPGAPGAVVEPPANPAELYATQLHTLTEMGFFDADANLRALVTTGGNVQAAVERLLG